jgi:hypothetical protein
LNIAKGHGLNLLGEEEIRVNGRNITGNEVVELLPQFVETATVWGWGLQGGDIGATFSGCPVPKGVAGAFFDFQAALFGFDVSTQTVEFIEDGLGNIAFEVKVTGC